MPPFDLVLGLCPVRIDLLNPWCGDIKALRDRRLPFTRIASTSLRTDRVVSARGARWKNGGWRIATVVEFGSALLVVSSGTVHEGDACLSLYARLVICAVSVLCTESMRSVSIGLLILGGGSGDFFFRILK